MTEEIDFILDSTEESMAGSVAHLEKSFLNIRAGKASPQMLGSVFVDYYGSATPLSQVANVNVPDARTITIQPWEKKMLQTIEKAIQVANLGFNPMNNGDVIIISVPPLTEERRRDLAKQAKAEAEDAKIGIRNARKDANTEIKKLEKEGTSEDICKTAEDEVQNLTNSFIRKVDELLAVKEAEIMKV
jgi:ribosome recycling factor